jgi:predicted nucleic acid-binding Zn ribbon protein
MNNMPPLNQDPKHSSKKCPECFTYIPIDAQVCPSCKTRVGKVTRSGMAARTTKWKTNILCIIAWIVFAIFIKYAFF